jgi:branched-chain amino acid transport system ATP-binding protein
MLKLTDVHTYYGDSHILQGVSLEVKEGFVVALIGRNGMGKTTVIRSIMGLTPPRKGIISFKEVNITGLPAYKVARIGIALVPQGRQIFPSLSVRENLLVASHYKQQKQNEWDLEKIWSLFPMIKERDKNKGNQLSGGEQQMLAIARALVANPDLILMDEPTEGLSPILVQEIKSLIQQLKERGHSILLIEQNLQVALEVSDYIYMISKGTIVHESTPEALRDNYEIQAKYLQVT